MLNRTLKQLVLAVVATTLLPVAALADIYRITVETGNEDYAGTNGNVTIELKGSKGSRRFPFDPPGNSSEKGHWDTGLVKLPDLGSLQEMTLELWENDSDDIDWFVSNVFITNMNTGQRADFAIGSKGIEKGRWLRPGNRRSRIDETTERPDNHFTYTCRQLNKEWASTHRAIERQRNR